MPYDIIVGRDDSDKKKFGDKGLVYLGRGYVKMGNLTSLSNTIFMDVARSHVVLVAGKRGSGKSYTLGVIAEELANLKGEEAKNIASLIFDTMGIFWTMKFKNDKEKELLQEWKLKGAEVPIKVFVPYGFYENYLERELPVDEKFAIRAEEMDVDDWIITFGLNMINPVSVVIERAVSRLKEKGAFDVDDIIKETALIDGKDEDKNAAAALFEAAKTWGVFASGGEQGTSMRELVEGGRTSVLDLSVYNSIGAFNVRALVIGLVCKKLFNERMHARKKEELEAVQHGLDYLYYKQKREMPLVWLFVDEAHEFLPLQGQTAATDALIQVLREGRQPGISIVMATQQPGQIHRDVMTQSDIVVSHRVTSKPDIEALNEIMQTYLLESIRKNMDDLPHLKGSAIILDDNSERIYPMRVRPRFTWHGGEAPTAVRAVKRE